MLLHQPSANSNYNPPSAVYSILRWKKTPTEKLFKAPWTKHHLSRPVKPKPATHLPPPHSHTRMLFSVISLIEWQKCLAGLNMDFKIDLSLEGGLKLTGKMVFGYLRIYVCTHAGHVQLVCHTGAGTASKMRCRSCQSWIFVCVCPQTDPEKVHFIWTEVSCFLIKWPSSEEEKAADCSPE